MMCDLVIGETKTRFSDEINSELRLMHEYELARLSTFLLESDDNKRASMEIELHVQKPCSEKELTMCLELY